MLFGIDARIFIWVIDIKGRVFQIDSNGDKLIIGTYNPDDIIGYGINNIYFWIALRQGIIIRFDDIMKPVKIVMP